MNLKRLTLLGLATALLTPTTGCAFTVKGPVTGKTYWNSMANTMDPAWGYYQECREQYVANRPDLPEPFRQAILARKIVQGMSAEDVKMSWALYGINEPRVNQTVTPRGTAEQWVIQRSGPGQQYLYFEDGILASWQNIGG